jgi:hypothetical protein
MPRKRILDIEALLVLAVAPLGLVSACQSGGTTQNISTPDAGQGKPDVPIFSQDASVVFNLDGGSATAIDGACVALTSCMVAGGQYCGIIGDGCTGNLNCGNCPAGQSCVGNICTSGSGYDAGVLTSCIVTGGQYCGTIGNGAGGKLDCGACATPGWICTDGLCTAAPSICTPTACQTTTGQYCGTVGDGCGHALACPACAAGQACVNNQCVPASGCVALTCSPTGGQYCGGLVGDGCGGSINCGDCTTPGWTCQNHLCKGGATCTPLACGTGAGKYCGTIGDGCGGSLPCGDCIAGETCRNNQCVPTSCTKLTCNPTGGQYCGGQLGDGCGGALDCSQPCPAGWTCLNHLCVGDATCTRVTSCSNGTPFNYCGDIGDNCGGVVHCGNDCAAGQVCDTTTGLCKGDANCVPKTCTNDTLFNYCGDIGDGCGGTVRCGDDCAAGQACDTTTGLCKGDADCVPVACDNGTPFNYCGEAGDGCGGSLPCGDDCDAGQVCGADGVCKGDASCVPIACDNGTPFAYCGSIGDGCGGRLVCSTKCATGQICGVDGLCKGDASCVPTTCDNGTEFNYCGTVGDGCGGALRCSTNCGTGKACDLASNVCKGDASCVPRTSCITGTDYNYCGQIGDGCGGSLNCNTDCGAGKVCDTSRGLCKADASCVPRTVCTNGTDFNYCGRIGDGCGSSVSCSTDCGTGKVCDTSKGLCHGDTNCVPLASCSNGTDYNYCGTIGDKCGGSRDCPTDCGAGKVCDTTRGVCKGDANCQKLSCANSSGVVQYCGGDIGDGCGGTLTCNGTCPAKTKCSGNVCVCDDGLRCQVATCSSGSTTITGTVYDPAGNNPLYNVMVYVPNAALPAIEHGPSCDQCAADPVTQYGDPITAAITGTDGSFTLTNAPDGTNIPLVMQIGKWRRRITIPTVAKCGTTTLDTSVSRLPRNKSDGLDVSLPVMAVAAGGAHGWAYDFTVTERLQCLLRRMGVSDSEFTLPTGIGSVRMYNHFSSAGCNVLATTWDGAACSSTPSADTCNQIAGVSGTYPDARTSLWNSATNLNQYDMIFLNCPGDANADLHGYPSHPGDTDRMKDYVDRGGRVFAEHYAWGWVRSRTSTSGNYTSAFGDVANWYVDDNGNPRSNWINDPDPSNVWRTATIDTSFARGAALASWLTNVLTPAQPYGQVNISAWVRETIKSQINPPGQRWMYEPQSSPAYIHFLTFNTPVGASAANQCGRFVFTGMHVSDRIDPKDAFPSDPTFNATMTNPAGAKTDSMLYHEFPTCCANRTALSPQEKILEFMIFDLSSCISTNGGDTPPIATPPPPPAPPPAPAPPPPPPPPPAPPAPPPASPPAPTAPSAPPPPPAPAPPAPPPPATTPPAPTSPPVPPPPPPPPPVAAPPPPPPPPPAQTPPPPPPPPPTPPPYIP